MKVIKITIILFAVLCLANFYAVSAQKPDNQSDFTLDAATRSQVVEGVIKRFNQSYFSSEIAKTVEQFVRERMRKGEYDKIINPAALAEMLKSDLYAVSKDKHIDVRFSEKPLPPMSEVEKAETAAERENRRQSFARINNGFLKVERLPGNVGFLDIDTFVDPAFAGDTATAAMNFLANTDALLVDLRYCTGGSGEMVNLLSSYFFAEPVHLSDYYQREGDITLQSWTFPYIAGQRYLNKNIYILISSRTFSAAEGFAYNLQNLNRAIVVGETSRGGAHPVRRYRINENFGVQVPVARVINAVTKTDWEGKGVLPDVPIATDKAVKVAHLAALKQILEKNPNQEKTDQIKPLIEKLEKELNAK